MTVLKVALTDFFYALRLTKYLDDGLGVSYEVMMEREGDEIKADVLLTDQIDKARNSDKAIFFCTEAEAVSEGWKGPVLDQYLPGSVMLCRIRREIETLMQQPEGSWMARESRKDSEGKAAQAQVIAVYGPCGGSGRTTLALSLCDVLSQICPGQRILYLNLESISDWRMYYTSQTAYNLSDFLYTLLMGDAGRGIPLSEIESLQYNGVFFIAPCNGDEDLAILSEQEAASMLGALSRRYDKIVCDMSTNFCGINQAVLKNCTYRYFLCPSTETGTAKWKAFLDVLRRQQLYPELMDERTQCLCLMKGGVGRSSARNRRDNRDSNFYDLHEEKELMYVEKDGLKHFITTTDWYQQVRRLACERVGVSVG